MVLVGLDLWGPGAVMVMVQRGAAPGWMRALLTRVLVAAPFSELLGRQACILGIVTTRLSPSSRLSSSCRVLTRRGGRREETMEVVVVLQARWCCPAMMASGEADTTSASGAADGGVIPPGLLPQKKFKKRVKSGPPEPPL